jgi:hypothetical protein
MPPTRGAARSVAFPAIHIAARYERGKNMERFASPDGPARNPRSRRSTVSSASAVAQRHPLRTPHGPCCCCPTRDMGDKCSEHMGNTLSAWRREVLMIGPTRRRYMFSSRPVSEALRPHIERTLPFIRKTKVWGLHMKPRKPGPLKADGRWPQLSMCLKGNTSNNPAGNTDTTLIRFPKCSIHRRD